jgi:hypothetical protein
MKHLYALEKLASAVHSMATDPGDIKVRLWNAFLIFHTLSEKDFANEYHEDWKFIYKSLTTEEPSYNEKGEVTTGRVENTLKILDEDACVKIAERIANLESKLRYE